MQSAHLRFWFLVPFLLLALGMTPSVEAHAFGQRYDLPVPLWLYLVGAAAAVTLSFVVMAFFLRRSHAAADYPRVNLLRWGLFRWLAHPVVLTLIRLISVGLFVLVLLTGFFGFPVTQYNFAPAFVWIIWWVGFAYISALLGDLWLLVNPWKILFTWVEDLYRWFVPQRSLSFRFRYPERLGVTPALVIFLLFAWMEHAYPDNAEPEVIAMAALSYSILTWVGMVLFGRDEWLARGEAFSIIFTLFARFAPTEVQQGKTAGAWQWNLRPFAAGLFSDTPVHLSKMLLVLSLLAVLALDGFLETPFAATLFGWWNELEAVGLISGVLGLEEEGAAILFSSLALLIFPLLFFAIYGLFMWLMHRVVGGREIVGGGTLSVGYLARLFALTLMPIAIAYHLAHYLPFLLIQGQAIIALASDPFGLDWDLFGTAYYRMNIGIIDARVTWFTAVTAIVVGHVIAVYLSHRVAMQRFGEIRVAVRSQYPMLVLMICYTMLSLWILAQPIVGF